MDAVYLFGGSSDGSELRYSLRSLVNLPQVDRVFVSSGIGHPGWLSGDVVRIVPERHGPGRFASAWANLKAAAGDDRLSDEFLLMNDDFFVLRPVDAVPVLHRCDLDAWRPKMSRAHFRMTATRAAMDAAGAAGRYCWEGHYPMVIRRDLFARTVAAVDAQRQDRGAVWNRTVYGNLAHPFGGTPAQDVKIHDHRAVPAAGDTFTSTSDSAWATGRVGEWLRARFPEPCHHERR